MASNAKIIGDLIAADSSVAIPGDGVILASDLADGSVTTAKLADANVTIGKIATTVPLGTKNLIINGNMAIAQRGTSSAGITSPGYYTVDRVRTNIPNTNSGTWTMSQDTDVPTGQGFSYSLKYQCTTAKATLDTNSLMQIHYLNEGQFLQHLKWGSSNAESVTLSFWVKSNKTGTYIVELFQQETQARTFSKSYTIDSANTWEKQTITFNGDTVQNLTNDNNNRLNILFGLVAGTDYTSGTLATSWQNLNQVDRYTGQVNLADSTSNYINITGVQLEVGDTATSFEHRPYDMELARCQRYYHAQMTSFSAADAISFLFNTYFPVTMRAVPTVSYSWGGVDGDFYRLADASTPSFSSPNGLFATTNGILTGYKFGTSFATGESYQTNWVLSAEL